MKKKSVGKGKKILKRSKGKAAVVQQSNVKEGDKKGVQQAPPESTPQGEIDHSREETTEKVKGYTNQGHVNDEQKNGK